MISLSFLFDSRAVKRIARIGGQSKKYWQTVQTMFYFALWK